MFRVAAILAVTPKTEIMKIGAARSLDRAAFRRICGH